MLLDLVPVRVLLIEQLEYRSAVFDRFLATLNVLDPLCGIFGIVVVNKGVVVSVLVMVLPRIGMEAFDRAPLAIDHFTIGVTARVGILDHVKQAALRTLLDIAATGAAPEELCDASALLLLVLREHLKAGNTDVADLRVSRDLAHRDFRGELGPHHHAGLGVLSFLAFLASHAM